MSSRSAIDVNSQRLWVVAESAGEFTVSGAPVGTFLRSALLIAGQKALGAP